MQLDLLTQSLEGFRTALDRGWASGLEGLYPTVAAWQLHWPPASPQELPATLDLCLSSSRTRAFWQGHAYFPKEVLIDLARFSPEVVNLAFGRLFNPELELGERFSGFVYYLDEVLAEYARLKPLKAPDIHYHADYRAPSLYTAARFPDTHAYFEADVYLAALRKLRAPQVGLVADASRFAKSVRIVLTFMAKNEKFAPSLASRADNAHRNPLPPDSFREGSALVVSEYFRWLSENG